MLALALALGRLSTLQDSTRLMTTRGSTSCTPVAAATPPPSPLIFVPNSHSFKNVLNGPTGLLLGAPMAVWMYKRVDTRRAAGNRLLNEELNQIGKLIFSLTLMGGDRDSRAGDYSMRSIFLAILIRRRLQTEFLTCSPRERKRHELDSFINRCETWAV